MSISIMAHVFKLTIPTGPKFVLLALADRACDRGYCYPGQQELAEKTSQSVRAIQNQLTWLEENGFITRAHRQRRDGYRTTDEYQIILGALSSPEPSSPELNSRENGSGENNDVSKANDVQGKKGYSIHQEEPSVSIQRAREEVRKPEDVSEGIWKDFVALRKKKRSPLTATALEGIRREADKAGWALQRALAECCARGWQGFKADWVAPKGQAPPKPKMGDEARQYAAMAVAESRGER